MNAKSISNALEYRLSNVVGAMADSSGRVVFFADEQVFGTVLVGMSQDDARALWAGLDDLRRAGKLGEFDQ